MKRGGQLTRRAPMRRGRMVRRPGSTKHSRRERDTAFMGWVSRQRCAIAMWFEELHSLVGYRFGVSSEHLRCDGRIEVDHAGSRFTDGDGTRAHDRTCIPLCTKHHLMRTNFGGTLGQAGIFFRFTCEMMRQWCAIAIERTQALAKQTNPTELGIF